MKSLTTLTGAMVLLLTGLAMADAPPATQAPAAAIPALPATPSCQPEVTRPLPAVKGRKRHCVVDIGSRNVKLTIASIEGGDTLSLAEERTCQTRLQLGEKTYDQASQTGRPLESADRESLARVVAAYVAQCKKDGGEISGAMATEWARRTTNIADIRRTVLNRAGLEFEVLDGQREGRYGYHAATRGVRGKLVLDFGSRSVQLTYWPLGTPAPMALALPLGIDEAGDRFFGNARYRDFRAAREAFLAAFRVGGRQFLTRVARDMKQGRLSPEIYSLAENGDVPLATAGKLWEGSAPITDQAYAAAIKTVQPTRDEAHGQVTAVLSAGTIDELQRRLERDPALVGNLRGDRIKRIFGFKMMAFSSLVGMLAHDLKAGTVVLVPQQMADGLIVDRLVPRSL
jgi:hypothetical protein